MLFKVILIKTISHEIWPSSSLFMKILWTVYFLADFESMLLVSLPHLQLLPSEQEKFFWGILKFLNQLEAEEYFKFDDMNEVAASNGSLPADNSYGIFWDEYRVIEQSTNQLALQKFSDLEDGTIKKEENNETKIQWLNDVGFTNIAKKFRDKTEIDQNDVDMKIIAASLTRAQANAVRQRIDALNEAIRQRKLNDASPRLNHNKAKRKDVRDLFNLDSNSQLPREESSQKYDGSKNKHIKQVYPPTVLQKPAKQNITQSEKMKLQQGYHHQGGKTIFISNENLDSNFDQSTKKEDNLVRSTVINNLVIKTGQEYNQDLKQSVRPKSLIIERDFVVNDPMRRKTVLFDGRNSNIDNDRPKGIYIKNTNGEEGLSKVKSIFEKKSYPLLEKTCSLPDCNNLPCPFPNLNSSYSPQPEQRSPLSEQRNLLPDQKTSLLEKSSLLHPLPEHNLSQSTKVSNIELPRSYKSSLSENSSQPNVVQKHNNSLTNHDGTEDKKLVRVDSKYIKVSNVEDDYITTTKNSERSPTLPACESEKKKDSLNDSNKKNKSDKNQSLSLLNMKNYIDVMSQSGSEDSKSVSSLGSAESFDELSLSLSKAEGSHLFDTIYDNVSNSSCLTDDKDTSDSFELVESPCNLGLDGDAKLDVGSVLLKEEKSLPETILGPSFPPLPNFTLTQDDLGMTRVGDLSELDMFKIRSLALIELTALFDAYSISMNRRKSPLKQRFKESGVFGVPLTALVQQGQGKKSKVQASPQVLKDMLAYIEKNGLNEEGILRVTGSIPRMKQIKEDLEKDFRSFSWEGIKICDVCTCLKQFLRELPVPLLSHEYQNTFAAVANLPDRKVQLQALNLLVLLLHPVHQETLKLLLSFLQKVVSHEAANKMGLNNVAMIMAPNLFFQNSAKINMDEAQKAVGMTDVLRMLIKYQQILWTIPSFMVTQIRYLYEAGANTKDPKSVKKIIAKRIKSNFFGSGLRGKSSESSGDELEDSDLIIRVKAPDFNKQSMAIQLTEKTTASDVIAKFHWRRQNSIKDEIDTSKYKRGKKENDNVDYCLCETGGNIGERILEPSSNISAILKVNPNAEWLLKMCPSA